MNGLLFRKTEKPFPAADLPEVIVESEPDFADFYQLAWKQAWDHVYESEVLPFSPYLSEGCKVNRIWIWDSCFMGMFCRYALRSFPGRATLDNLYALRDQVRAPIRIHHRDNPPLYAWIEWMYYQMDSSKNRLREVLPKLTGHYEFLENIDPADHPADVIPVVAWKREREGYCWSGLASGMDNTPRGRDRYDSIWWVDALAQQALSARYIGKIASALGETDIALRYQREFENKKALLQRYWDEETGAFLDRCRDGSGFCRVLTPASFWPLFADCATEEQRKRQIELLKDPRKLGGIIPFPSVSRDDPAFDPDGGYWRGSVWLPVAYMGIKTLEQYGEYALAAKLSLDLLHFMLRTWKEYSPHTIWECYAPEGYRPATGKPDKFYGHKTVSKIVRTDFCGWSALGPISLLIENIIGISGFDSDSRTIVWQPGLPDGALGVRNLNFSGGRVDLVRENGSVTVRSDFPMTLIYQKRKLDCRAGENRFPAAE